MADEPLRGIAAALELALEELEADVDHAEGARAAEGGFAQGGVGDHGGGGEGGGRRQGVRARGSSRKEAVRWGTNGRRGGWNN